MFSNKFAHFQGTKSMISLVLGLIIGLLGLVPLLNSMGTISFGIPTLPQRLLQVLLIVGGTYLLIDAWDEDPDYMKWANVVVGILVIIVGAIPILNIINVIGFTLPALLDVVYQIIEVIIGILLIIGSFLQ